MKTLNNINTDTNSNNVIDITLSKVTITQPRIDKIALNFNINTSEHQKHIRDYCLDKEKKHPGVFITKGKRYHIQLTLRLPDKNGELSEEIILVQFAPYNKKAAFVRIEYNPSKISQEHYDYFDKFMFEALDIHLAKFLKKAWATRLDICLDIFNVTTEDVIMQTAQTRGRFVCFANDGTIGTVYHGKSSGNQVKLYNKAEEQGIPGKHLRLEWTIRGKKILLSKLPEMPNPFLKTTICDFRLNHKLPIHESVVFELLKDSCRYRGNKHALMRLPEAIRKKFSKLISKSAASWWKPEDFWGEHWVDALREARLIEEQYTLTKFVSGEAE